MARTHFEQRSSASRAVISRDTDLKYDRAKGSAEAALSMKKDFEHIQGIPHLIAYLETPGHEASKVESYDSTDGVKWSPQKIRLNAQRLRARVGKAPSKDSVALSVPENIHPNSQKPGENTPIDRYSVNIWNWEPELLDDLERAKAKNDNEALQDLRKIIRAGSWDTHRSTNDDSAKVLALQWQERLEKQPADAQLELRSIMNTDLEPVEDLVKLFSSKKPQCGPETEKTVFFLEEKLREAWKSFNTLYRETRSHLKRESLEHGDDFTGKNNPLQWPATRFGKPFEQKVRGPSSGHIYDFSEFYDAYTRIVELRQMRDQAYYHLLYPVFCSFIEPSN